VNYAQLLFPDFSLILCGYLVCRYTALDRTVWAQVEALVYFMLFPVLLFHSIVKSPLDLHAASSLIGAGWALGLCVCSCSTSQRCGPWRVAPSVAFCANRCATH
jgi:predicted permease